jgi:hypothetical protein
MESSLLYALLQVMSGTRKGSFKDRDRSTTTTQAGVRAVICDHNGRNITPDAKQKQQVRSQFGTWATGVRLWVCSQRSSSELAWDLLFIINELGVAAIADVGQWRPSLNVQSAATCLLRVAGGKSGI